MSDYGRRPEDLVDVYPGGFCFEVEVEFGGIALRDSSGALHGCSS